MVFKARYKTGSEDEFQILVDHLTETGMYVELFGKAIGLPKPALLAGLLHDLGKNCETWQAYLEESVKSGKTNDKEDHATAGGQYLYEIIAQSTDERKELVGQFLAACIMYHHGPGLSDVIKPDGTAKLYGRLQKPESETHVNEAVANFDSSIKEKITEILQDANFIGETAETLINLAKIRDNKANTRFNIGLTARFLASCLLDADRTSSAYYDRGIPLAMENAIVKANWKHLCSLLEKRLGEFSAKEKINTIRASVSERCAEFAERESGIYTLTAATGAGKTLAALRYALVHAEKYNKERIFIIAPYTSILDQNADCIRDILDPDGENGTLILEQHSNLDRNELSEHFADSSQTWNVPIVITTMVQFLEALFGSGTRKIRRMHRFSNSVIIFDEIQTLPVSCTYLFNWAIQYLCKNAGTSVLLCTATQPGLDKLKPEYALQLPEANEIISNIADHFADLKRVELVDETRTGGRTLLEAADFINELSEKTILTVVNTKPQAQILYAELSRRHPEWEVVHLSTNMCPAHRRKVISDMKETLRVKKKKCVCISTRLIEAGVDIDFDTAIRFLAGLDSIIQTAGRCNRNGTLVDLRGNLVTGKTYIFNIVKDDEHIESLQELVLGQRQMERILREYHDDEAQFNYTLLHPDIIARYFSYFYGALDDSLLKHKVFAGRDDTVLDLLSTNQESVSAFSRIAGSKYTGKIPPVTVFCQSFESAWSEFEAIASDTIGVLVPYGKGKDIIAELYGTPDAQRISELLRDGQQYSVNVYFSGLQRLVEQKVIKKITIKPKFEVYAVEDGHYDSHIGLSREFGGLSTLNV